MTHTTRKAPIVNHRTREPLLARMLGGCLADGDLHTLRRHERVDGQLWERVAEAQLVMHTADVERAYGYDVTPKMETLAEATRNDDGTIHYVIVQLDPASWERVAEAQLVMHTADVERVDGPAGIRFYRCPFCGVLSVAEVEAHGLQHVRIGRQPLVDGESSNGACPA